MASLTIVPTSGNVISVSSATVVTVVSAEQNDNGAYATDTTTYPRSPEMRYYITFELGGDTLGRSYVFGVDETGGHKFMNYIFPEAGSWTVRLNDASDDSSVATASVTVS